MINERITENLVREDLRLGGYYTSPGIEVSEQRSPDAGVQRLLKGASKTGGQGIGAPEFIVTSADAPDLIMIIECKAQVSQHESVDRDRPAQFAVDGVLHYARALAREFNVIALAVSGQDRDTLQVASFFMTRGESVERPLQARDGAIIDRVVSFADFREAAEFDPQIRRARERDLREFSRELHIFMRDQAKLTEAEKPLLVSGTILALRNQAFARSYGDYAPADLPAEWLRVVTVELEKADVPGSKKKQMAQPYSSIAVSAALGSATKKYHRGILHELIRMLAERVMPFVTVYHDFDVVGSFYGEFLRYTGGDKKGLGIVLTPRHITELFALLANVGKADCVVDPCAGTGGFLIASMSSMMAEAVTEEEREDIRKNRLIGIEIQANMFALAASNMILRGDGKANLYPDDCFDPMVIAKVKGHHPNIGLMNPPYAQKDAELDELLFVQNMLNMLEPGGIGIAIVPISCATGTSPHKAAILKRHTLEAVMSMPTEVFYPVGVVTCVMVFRAGQPHAAAKKKTWFGYWKDDGFVKTKHLGRVDIHNTWAETRDSWVEDFRNRVVLPGRSVSEYVTADDEWCAEAYMETDYSALSATDFTRALREYAIFSLTAEAEAAELEYLNAGTVDD